MQLPTICICISMRLVSALHSAHSARHDDTRNVAALRTAHSSVLQWECLRPTLWSHTHTFIRHIPWLEYFNFIPFRRHHTYIYDIHMCIAYICIIYIVHMNACDTCMLIVCISDLNVFICMLICRRLWRSRASCILIRIKKNCVS